MIGNYRDACQRKLSETKLIKVFTTNVLSAKLWHYSVDTIYNEQLTNLGHSERKRK